MPMDIFPALTGSEWGGAGDTWDPMTDYFGMKQNTEHFMSLWRSYKPTIARIHGPAVVRGQRNARPTPGRRGP